MRTVGFKDIGSMIIAAVIEESLASVPRQLPRGTFALCAALDAVL